MASLVEPIPALDTPLRATIQVDESGQFLVYCIAKL
jgi:hypothetical protein